MIEAWITVLVALIVALSTLGATFINNRRFQKRFEKELARQREVDERQRRWEVRGKPLLKLRDALAVMATKLHILVTNTQWSRNQSDITEEVENKESQRALDDYRDYITSGDFLPTLYSQYDTELIHLVEPIENGYLLLFEYALNWKNLKEGERKAFRDISLNTKNMIPEAQELINKRLEEL